MACVGILALQGGFAAHALALREIGLGALEVRDSRDLDRADGLVLPGGESTAQLRLVERHGLADGLEAFVAAGRPVLATCAGLILSARRVRPDQRSFGWLDVEVDRNAYGRQLDSFEDLSDEGLPLVFIRAPRIAAVGPGVAVLARWHGEPVLVRAGAVTGGSFHPELTPDRRVHRLAFADLAVSGTLAPGHLPGQG
jgi:pyridoxal 5'-phosphate synthase pdxT subunit